MRVNISYPSMTADVGTIGHLDAGWVGYRFAKNNPDLTKAGWSLHYYLHSDARFDSPDTLVMRWGVTELAERIRCGPSPSPTPSGFVGPFGEGRDA